MAVDERIFRDFERVGRALFIAGLQNTHSGNMSIRVGKKMIITTRGSMLGFLRPEDLVEVPVEGVSRMVAIASTEAHLHAAIYRETDALAVIHAHLVAATALTLIYDEIIPIDVEGAYHTRRIPSLEFEFASGSDELAKEVPKYLKDYPIVMIKGHGAIAVGDTLEEAAFYCSSVENSAKIILAILHAGKDPTTFQPERFKRW